MKDKFRSLFIGLTFLMVVVSAIGLMVPLAVNVQAAAQAVATATPRLTPTSQQNSPTPLVTPTLPKTVAFADVKPGIYDTGGCAQFKPFGAPEIVVNLCVVNMEVLKDGSLTVAVSWTITGVPVTNQVTKLSYLSSPDIILRDNLGGRYPQTNAGGGAYADTILENGVPVMGWFAFPPPNLKATSFWLALDYGVKIEGLKLNKLLFTRNEMDLKWYEQTLYYPSNQWTAGKTEAGGEMIELVAIPGCTIEEWPAGEFESKYKNTMAISDITFEIHGWLEDTYGVREYLAQKVGYVKIDKENQAFFHTRIPLDKSAQCLSKIGEILATMTDTSTH